MPDSEPRLTPYARLWKGALEPVWERLRGKRINALERELAISQYHDWPRIQDRQWRDLETLLAHAFEWVPFYRDLAREKGLSARKVAAARDLGLLPLLDRGRIMADPTRFRSPHPPAGSFIKATGGTTGEPTRFLVSPESDDWRQAVSRRGYLWAGCTGGIRQLHLWSGELQSPDFKTRLKQKVHRRLLRQIYVSNFNLGTVELDRALEVVDRFKPEVIVSFASSVESLARRALENGWRPAAPLRSVIVGAEPLSEPARELIEQAFICPVFESYGNREFMLMAMECPRHNGLHISAENLMIEIIADGRPAAPGELGEVAVTDLHNLAQPFIRYRTGDLAAWAPGDCPCGRSLPRLARIEGRLMDQIRRLDGRPLTGGFFPHLLKDYEAIRQYQAEQDRPDHIILRLALRHPLDPADQSHITAKINQALPGIELEFAIVEEIPKTRLGKVRMTIGYSGPKLKEGESCL